MYENFQLPDITSLYTHNGRFHADEVFATVILTTLYPDAKLHRVSHDQIPKKQKDSRLIYDIGGQEFDHHQQGGNGVRPNGVPYASAGLIWKKFGPQYIETVIYRNHKEVNLDTKQGRKHIQYILDRVDSQLIQSIDADDNGIDIPIADNAPFTPFSVSKVINTFNGGPYHEHESFHEAVYIASTILRSTCFNAAHETLTIRQVENSLKRSFRPEIVILDRCYAGWKIVANKHADLLFGIWASPKGGYTIQGAPLYLDSLAVRVNFPENWRGLTGDELCQTSGIKDAMFCHQSGFLAVAETKESAIKMAEIAIEYDKNHHSMTAR